MKKYIDIESWERKDQFYLFNNMDYPHFNITANIDITKAYTYLKSNDFSFFKTMVYLVSMVSNNIKEFRYRIEDDKVVEYDYINPSTTVLTKPEVFSFCTINFTYDYKNFVKNMTYQIEKLKDKVDIEDDPNTENLIYITSIPWISFTSITHPIHMNPSDSIPRIAWGKYFNDTEKVKLPFSVQVNHALMDGVHVGKFFNSLQETLDNIEKHV